MTIVAPSLSSLFLMAVHAVVAILSTTPHITSHPHTHPNPDLRFKKETNIIFIIFPLTLLFYDRSWTLNIVPEDAIDTIWHVWFLYYFVAMARAWGGWGWGWMGLDSLGLQKIIGHSHWESVDACLRIGMDDGSLPHGR